MRPWLRVSWILLLVSGLFSFLIEGGLLVEPVAPDFARLPRRFGTLEVVEELPVDPVTLGDQPPERHAYLAVRDARGNPGRLFLAYYRRAQRWSGRPHDVDKCFAALGWEEREARQLAEAHLPWSRRFEQGDESIRVVHWLEHPGAEASELGWRSVASRLGSWRGLRPDVVSVYFEFDERFGPSEPESLEAVHALSAELDRLW